MSKEVSQKTNTGIKRPRFGFTVLLGWFLPTRTKRLILFASLSARFCGDKSKFTSSTLHKLNSVMALSSEDKALALPVHLSKAIWKTDAGNVTLYPAEHPPVAPTDDIVNAILNEIPDWLKYANRKGMREDLVNLLNHQDLIVS